MNGKIMYNLLNEPSRLFGIDSATGRIRVLGPISKENQRIYGFDVKATDRNGDDDGKSAIANVFVSVFLKLFILEGQKNKINFFRFMYWMRIVRFVLFCQEDLLKSSNKQI